MSQPAKKAMKKPTTKAASSKAAAGFTAEERAAMKERARELKAEKTRAGGEGDLLAKIAEMKEPDRGMATRLFLQNRYAAIVLVGEPVRDRCA